jgi:hypothetical protein
MTTALAIFALIVLAGYAVQTTTGFGSMILCVTFGAHLFSLEHVLSIAVPLSLVQNGYIVLRHRDGIDWRLLLGSVLPLMGAGAITTLVLFSNLDAPWLRTAFALMVLALSLRELARQFRPSASAAPPSTWVSRASLLGAGAIHGLYATGGPLLVYAIGRRGLSKHVFRSTVTTVWLVLNSLLCVAYTRAGRLDRDVLVSLAWVLPAVPLGIWLGEVLHNKVDERRFRIVVFVVLLVAAVALLIR